MPVTAYHVHPLIPAFVCHVRVATIYRMAIVMHADNPIAKDALTITHVSDTSIRPTSSQY